MLYTHQYPDWTKFRYDSKKVTNALGQVRFAEGRLAGITSILENGNEEDIFVSDIVTTYAIDGEKISHENITAPDENGMSIIDKYHQFMETQDESSDTFEESHLFKWQSTLSGNHRAGYRKVESYIQDNGGKTVFAGPGPERVQQEMTNFITWFNISQTDAVIKAAIAQFWFLTIRPFEHSNGKIARMLTNMLLYHSNGTGMILYSINEQILQDRENYFRILSSAQAGNGDLTEWILWFLKTMLRAIRKREEALNTQILSARFKNKKNMEKLPPRSREIVDAILSGALPQPFNVKEVAAHTGTSHDSALRDIQKLIEFKLASPTKKGGRSTRYSLIL